MGGSRALLSSGKTIWGTDVRLRGAWGGLEEKPQPEPEGLVNHITKFTSCPRDDEKKAVELTRGKKVLILNDITL